MTILMVLTSSVAAGRRTGLRIEEFSSAYYRLLDAGQEVVLASPGGAMPTFASLRDADAAAWPELSRLRCDADTRAALADPLVLSEVYASDFLAVFYPGGEGAGRDLPHDPHSLTLLSAMLTRNAPVALVSEAPAALLGARNADGTAFVAGRRLTCAAAAEVIGPSFQPAKLGVLLQAAGARVTTGASGLPHVIDDRGLITGQNTASARAAAERLLGALGD